LAVGSWQLAVGSKIQKETKLAVNCFNALRAPLLILGCAD